MKKFTITFLFGLWLTPTIWAIDLGTLDLSFSNDGVSDGWDTQGSSMSGLEYYGSDVIVDSQGRILVVGTYEFELASGIEDKAAQLFRYLPNGALDLTFGVNGRVQLNSPPAPFDQLIYEMALNGNDGVFIGYSRLFCPTFNDEECHSDIRVNHVNANGIIVDAITVPFDLGDTFQRQDDIFADLIFVPSLNKVAITAEVERTSSDDTDFGILVLNSDPVSGALSLDTNFSGDGKHQCFFDQANPSGSRDKASALLWDANNNSFIVGGSAFEGNGISADGWNMAFCEFNLSGSLLRQWSTQNITAALDSREFLSDMAFTINNGSQQLIVAGSLPGPGGFDYAVTRYNRDAFGGMSQDMTFGSDGTGWSTIGFSYFPIGQTNDSPAEIYIENDGNILLAGTISNPNPNAAGFRSAVGLAKLRPSGKLNQSWGVSNIGRAVHTFDITSFWDSALAVTENPQTEEIYIAGFSYNGNFNLLLANFHNDGIFAGDFE